MSVPEYDVSYHWTRSRGAGREAATGWTTIGHAFVNPKGRIKICFQANPVPGLATTPGEFMLFPKLPEKTLQDRAAQQAVVEETL